MDLPPLRRYPGKSQRVNEYIKIPHKVIRLKRSLSSQCCRNPTNRARGSAGSSDPVKPTNPTAKSNGPKA
jgi:hypothetical protein